MGGRQGRRKREKRWGSAFDTKRVIELGEVLDFTPRRTHALIPHKRVGRDGNLRVVERGQLVP